jgi:hypothetical protein
VLAPICFDTWNTLKLECALTLAARDLLFRLIAWVRQLFASSDHSPDLCWGWMQDLPTTTA